MLAAAAPPPPPAASSFPEGPSGGPAWESPTRLSRADWLSPAVSAADGSVMSGCADSASTVMTDLGARGEDRAEDGSRGGFRQECGKRSTEHARIVAMRTLSRSRPLYNGQHWLPKPPRPSHLPVLEAIHGQQQDHQPAGEEPDGAWMCMWSDGYGIGKGRCTERQGRDPTLSVCRSVQVARKCSCRCVPAAAAGGLAHQMMWLHSSRAAPSTSVSTDMPCTCG